VEEVVEAVTVAVPGPLGGDPAILGLPSFVVGSVALGLALVGVTPAAAVGAPAGHHLGGHRGRLDHRGGLGRGHRRERGGGHLRHFRGFWLSYAVLVVGLIHGWFGITALAVVDTEKLFLIAWLVIIVLLTLATLRLPLAFTAVFVLIDVALLLLVINTFHASSGLTKTAGYVVLAFAALGAYLFVGSASVATGGKPLPLGRPVLHG
jgi:Predicted membrane protein